MEPSTIQIPRQLRDASTMLPEATEKGLLPIWVEDEIVGTHRGRRALRGCYGSLDHRCGLLHLGHGGDAAGLSMPRGPATRRRFELACIIRL